MNSPIDGVTTNVKVLIADDDPIFRRMLESLLTKWGFTVETAIDGSEVWNILQDVNAPSLAIVDWMMPGIDGLEICRRIKAELQYRSIYTILITGYQQLNDCVIALEAGADDFIVKPVNPAELHARLRAGARIVEYQHFLQTLAMEDPLTGLGNRRAFSTDLERMYVHSLRHGYSFALMIADIDGFKKINDHLGHDIGDQVLKQVATTLKSAFRAEDTSYRLGGDEFGTLFPDISSIESLPTERLNTQLKLQLKEAHIRGLSVDSFSLSIGTAFHTIGNPLSAEELFRYADQSMYAGKNELNAVG